MKGVDMDISGGPEQLRIIVKGFSARVEDIDSQGSISFNHFYAAYLMS